MQTSASNNFNFEIYYLSEGAVTVEFGDQIDEAILPKISSFNALIHQNPIPGFLTTVPAYTTLSVFFDPLTVYQSKDLTGLTCFEKLANYLSNLKQEQREKIVSEGDTVTIPVLYGGEFGSDLEYIAQLHKTSVEEVIYIHTNATYKVFMIGFVPGFAYLGGLSDLLETPRKQTPRKVIPAGSVGIAGKQTGIYPLETPGGWQLIGRTPLTLFNPKNSQPSLLKAGDRVIFKAISEIEYQHYQENASSYS